MRKLTKKSLSILLSLLMVLSVFAGLTFIVGAEDDTEPERPPEEHVQTLIKVEAVEPSCNKDGNITYWYCEICNRYYKDANADKEITVNQTIAKAPDHNYEMTGEKKATCTEEGKKTFTCTVCQDSYDEVVDKKAHKDADGDGYCDGCGKNMNPDVCLLCGKTHTGTFQKIIQVIHHLIWALSRAFSDMIWE